MENASEPYLRELNPGYFEYQLPISVKAAVIWNDRVPLLKNERDEWELPGGKLEVGETPEETLHREILEELSWDIEIHQPLHAWVYKIRPDRHVFVLTFLGKYHGDSEPKYSHEHKDLILVNVNEVNGLHMPDEYKQAIWAAQKAG